MGKTGAMEGMLVVAVEQAVAAPFCTARLADAGARVIKIEREAGDFARFYDRAARGDSSYFVWLNQAKQSVVLDFKTQSGAQNLERLIARADVFVQNLAPGAMQRAGFGSDNLRRRFPRLVTCDISGYGSSEALAKKKAYDFLVQAESGLVAISGGPGEMGRIGVSVCDIGAGMSAHAAIMEALLKRERTGKGSGVAVSLFDVAAEWMSVPLIHHEYGNGGPTRQGLHHPSIAPYGAYATGDGALTIISIQNEREWGRLCVEVFEKPAMQTDARFKSNNDRVANRHVMDDEISVALADLSAEGFRTRLQKASIAYGALNSLDGLSGHPGLRRRTVHTSRGKAMDIPAPPICRSYDENLTMRAPEIGQDTDTVLAEFCDQQDGK